MAVVKPFNPFYVLLVVAGVAFCVSACAYGVTAMRDLRALPTPAALQPAHALTAWFRVHGAKLLAAELLVLGIGTVGAIATDGYWTRRAADADRRRRATETTSTQANEE